MEDNCPQHSGRISPIFRTFVPNIGEHLSNKIKSFSTLFYGHLYIEFMTFVVNTMKQIYNDYVPTKEDSLKWYGNKSVPRRIRSTL